ncbi:MAG: FHA domain-containing protein [Clostridia bacterium]|nr:FHA domain-containing protein [Clostridia bacterium]
MPRNNEYNNFGTQPDTPFNYTVSPSTPINSVSDDVTPGVYRPTQVSGESGSRDTEVYDQISVDGEQIRPVVGWLVCIQGPCRGKDFRLHTERNYIGRDNASVDISIPDTKISRDNPAIQIAYDPVGRGFYVAACTGAKQNSYFNGRLLMSEREMQVGDIIKLGETELMFVPFCGEKFDWGENA